MCTIRMTAKTSSLGTALKTCKKTEAYLDEKEAYPKRIEQLFEYLYKWQWEKFHSLPSSVSNLLHRLCYYSR